MANITDLKTFCDNTGLRYMETTSGSNTDVLLFINDYEHKFRFESDNLVYHEIKITVGKSMKITKEPINSV